MAPKTITDAARQLRAGTLTAVELTESLVSRAEACYDTLGAFVAVQRSSALKAAAIADTNFARGIDHGPLQGIPLAVKDIISTKDAPTTASSRALSPPWGQGIDASVVARLRHAGAVILGKSTTSEFACGMPDSSKGFPIPRNPWDLERTPSGSSSGNGVAIAANLALGGIGTDTGGSIRTPAAANGHTGMKVTFGRVPTSGVIPLASSLDTVGPMARSARDCAIILDVISGDRSSVEENRRQLSISDGCAIDGDLSGIVVGMPIPYFFDDPTLDEEVCAGVYQVAEQLRSCGAEVSEIEIPYAGEANHAAGLMMVSEGYAYHRRNLQKNWFDYGYSARDFIGRGALYTASDYIQAQRFRSFFANEVAKAMNRVDILLTPTTNAPAAVAEIEDPGDRLFLHSNYTRQWNLTGAPALAAPCGFSSQGLPISFQLVGRPFEEAAVLKVAAAYQCLTDWHLKTPEIYD